MLSRNQKTIVISDVKAYYSALSLKDTKGYIAPINVIERGV